MNWRALIIVLCSAVSFFIVQSCSENNEEGTGRLIVKLSDAPFDYSLVKEANVTINKVELRKKDSDSSSFMVLSENELAINLLDLQNGITEELVNLEVPVGEYDLIRLYIANSSIVLQDEQEFDLKIPSGAQSGLKVFVKPTISVTSGLTTELLLDFDVSKSFVPKGNLDLGKINGFNFKPVIRAVNLTFAGRIQGQVADSVDTDLENAMVWLEKDTVVASTSSDASGFYALTGIPAGEFDLFCTKDGYDTLSVSGVSVGVGNVTNLDLEINQLSE